MEFIGKTEIYRPDSELAGIDGTREMYHFAGTNTPKFNASTTTEGLEDYKLVLVREGGRRLSVEEKERLVGLGEVKVVKARSGWKGSEVEGPMSGKETVVVRKVNKTFHLRTRLASCFCSWCQLSQYQDCHINRTYPGLVPAIKAGQVKKTVIMDTGVYGTQNSRKKKKKVWYASDDQAQLEVSIQLYHSSESATLVDAK